MRVIDPNTIINLIKVFNKKFKNKMQLIVDAVQDLQPHLGLQKFL